MSSVRAGQPGATRFCPHCKATVLESAAICPGCHHHLRFSGGGRQLEPIEGYRAFSIDGTIAHKPSGEPCEYCIVLDISNERGEQVIRQIVGVGALQPGERRRVNLSIDMLPLVKQVLPKAQATASAAKPGQPAAAAPLKPTPAPAAAAAKLPAGTRPAAAAAAAVSPATTPAVGASASAAAPATPTAPAASAAVPRPAPQSPGAQGSGGTLGQRLGIFRKP